MVENGSEVPENRGGEAPSKKRVELLNKMGKEGWSAREKLGVKQSHFRWDSLILNRRTPGTGA